MKKLLYYTLTAMLFSFGSLWAQQWEETNDNHTTGKLGIGTSTPETQLEIVSTPSFNAYEANSLTLRSWNSSSSNDNRMLGMTITLDGPSKVHNIYQKSVGIFAQSSGNWSNNVDMLLYTRGTNEAPYFTEKMRIKSNGNVGIGTATPDEKLTVKGTIHTEEVRVDLNVPAPDYVFEPDYKLRSLQDTENYINKNKHLPEIPSAKEMEAHGVELGDMNMLLLKKIEELTLYIIDLQKQVNELKEQTKNN